MKNNKICNITICLLMVVTTYFYAKAYTEYKNIETRIERYNTGFNNITTAYANSSRDAIDKSDTLSKHLNEYERLEGWSRMSYMIDNIEPMLNSCRDMSFSQGEISAMRGMLIGYLNIRKDILADIKNLNRFPFKSAPENIVYLNNTIIGVYELSEQDKEYVNKLK